MTTNAKLMAKLDSAALALLARAFPEVAPDPPVALTDQTKAFDSVTRYFGPRTKVPDEEKKDSPFDQLRSGLSRKARGKRSAATLNGGSADTDTAGTA